MTSSPSTLPTPAPTNGSQLANWTAKTTKPGNIPPHVQVANALISLILIIMLGFILFMVVFFWRKYKHISLSVADYQYSQLSQNDGDADFTEVAEQLGLSLSNSSTDDEISAERLPFQDYNFLAVQLEPATLAVTTSQFNSVNGSRINGTIATVGTIGAVSTVQVLGSSLLDESDEELLQ